MKRFQEKIKDLVENPIYEAVENYRVDLPATLSAYRFTEVTAELMAKWLDAIADLARNGGSARALAGDRGVGKSHFISVVGAIAAQTELRGKITYSYVLASSERLQRRKFTVVRVERGTRETLAAEFAIALAQAFNTGESDWRGTIGDMLAKAVSISGEPFIILIDSAYNRSQRVERDDGATLGKMAEEVKKYKIFIAVALDDDIAGADGVNAAIARTYTIDYLNQEHLYQIVNSFLYQKRLPARPILRELYQSLQNVVPGFSWSEQRFTALYPIHPVVADVTPAVRMYAQNFAFLPFAAEIGGRMMNRPAHSLVALDEVFDRVESELRKAEELKEVFAGYDALTTQAISQIPVMQRLQAKLILKGLLILSLDGRGATAREISAAMLIYDENQPAAAIEKISQILELFAASGATKVMQRRAEGADFRYTLRVEASANFESDLAALAKTIPLNRLGGIMHEVSRSYFADFKQIEAAGESSTKTASATDFLWRGGIRHGKLKWLWNSSDNAAKPPETSAEDEICDWELIICPPAAAKNIRQNFPHPTLIWEPAPLTAEETETLRRSAALHSTSALSEKYGAEAAIASQQIHRALIERVWARIFLKEGNLFANSRRLEMTEEAMAGLTVKDGWQTLFAPIFDENYPAHPNFESPLELDDLSVLVSEFFGGGDQNSFAVQELARIYALPLGLVAQRGSHYVIETEEAAQQQSWMREISALIAARGNEILPLEKICRRLKAAPYGFTREMTLLILAALVAHRRYEFITNSGERIGRRSLNLRIIWSEIAGIGHSVAALHEATELASWAKILTGLENVSSLDYPADGEKIRLALIEWLDNWNSARISGKFEALPDEAMNTQVWRIAARTQKTFGAVAEAVEAAIDNVIPLTEGLQRIADAFADSREEFDQNIKELNEFKSFLEAASQRVLAEKYLALAAPTAEDSIEKLRLELSEMLRNPSIFLAPQAGNTFSRHWAEFQSCYIEYYVVRHDSIMQTPHLPEAINNVVQSGEWEEFEFLSSLAIGQNKFRQKAANLQARGRSAECCYNVRQVLEKQPHCHCGFRLGDFEGWQNLPAELIQTMNSARQSYRRTLSLLSQPLAETLQTIANREKNPQIAERARILAGYFAADEELPLLSRLDLRILELALGKMSAPPLSLQIPALSLATREELRRRLNHWLDDLPPAPTRINLGSDEFSLNLND